MLGATFTPPQSQPRLIPFGVYVSISPFAAPGNYFPYSLTPGHSFTLVEWNQAYVIPAGINNGANFWTISLIFDTTGAVIASFNTSLYVVPTRNVVNTIRSFTPAAIPGGNGSSPLSMTVVSTGGPGALYLFGPMIWGVIQ